MSKVYTTVQGDTLDQICAAYYGYTSGTVEAVLKANDGLAGLGAVYVAGVKITLPDVDTAEPSGVSLFGSSPDSSDSDSDSTAEELVEAHKNSTSAHPDIRASIKNRTTFADVAKATAKAVATEAVAREATDAALTSDLAFEVARAKSAESTLAASAVANTGLIEAEATRAKTAESLALSSLQVQATAISAESTRAKAAEAENAANITAEQTRAAGAEATIAANLVTETTRAKAVEATKADLVDGKVPSNQLPSYVDDVVELDALSAAPAIGETGKIYVTKDTNLNYRWSGSDYVEISKSLGLGENAATAYRGDRGKVAYDHSQKTGNAHGLTPADLGLGTVLADIDALSARARTLSTSVDITVDGYLFGNDFTFPTGYAIDRILCRNVGATAVTDDAEVALRLTDATGDYVSVCPVVAASGWHYMPVSLPLAFYTSAGRIYITLKTGDDAAPSIQIIVRLITL
jgi:phage tail protein X